MMKIESDRFIYVDLSGSIFLFYVVGLFCVLRGYFRLYCVGIFLLGDGILSRNRVEFLLYRA